MKHQLKAKFSEYATDRRIKISQMSRIINAQDNMNERDIDILLGAFIVFLYAYWEGLYKQFNSLLYERHHNITIDNLPYVIKSNVLLDINILKKDKDIKFKEVDDIQKFIKIVENIEKCKKESVSNVIKDRKNIKNYFIVNTNNPKIEDVGKLVKLYNLNLDNILKLAEKNETLSVDFKEKLSFIINTRNEVAHGSDTKDTRGYRERIISDFSDRFSPNSSLDDICDFLTLISFEMQQMFTEIIEEFEKKCSY